MKPHAALVETLFQEMKGRIKEADSSVPQKDGDWVYWVEYEEGAEYKKWYRKPASGSGETQLILDEVAMAAGKDYFRLAELSVSPDGKLMAYSFDDNGSERFEARIRNLETGQSLPDTHPGTLSSLVWTSGHDAILYGLANANLAPDKGRLPNPRPPV